MYITVVVFSSLQGTDQEEDTELSVYCVTCGTELNQKGALRHMEKCYLKVCFYLDNLPTITSYYFIVTHLLCGKA